MSPLSSGGLRGRPPGQVNRAQADRISAALPSACNVHWHMGSPNPQAARVVVGRASGVSVHAAAPSKVRGSPLRWPLQTRLPAEPDVVSAGSAFSTKLRWRRTKTVQSPWTQCGPFARARSRAPGL
jgi:hypothetical protein